jgi:hypothetical protein
MMPSKLASRFSLLALTTGLLLALTTPASAQESKPGTTHIAFSAKLVPYIANYGDKPTFTVAVNGVTNLPKGSVLFIYIYDYIGQGSSVFNEEKTTTVGPTGEFIATIKPKSGSLMRANLQCDVTFFLNWPGQPASVVRKYGKRGENLSGPQTFKNSGGNYLEAVTVVAP